MRPARVYRGACCCYGFAPMAGGPDEKNPCCSCCTWRAPLTPQAEAHFLEIGFDTRLGQMSLEADVTPPVGTGEV